MACIEHEPQQTLADLRQILRKRYAITWTFHFLSITHTFTNDTGDLLLDEQQPFDTLGVVYPFVRVSARGEVPAPLCQWLSPVDQTDMCSLIQFTEQLVEWRDATIPQELLHAPPSIASTALSNVTSFQVHLERPKKSYDCSSSMTCSDLLKLILHDDNKRNLEYYNASTRPMLKFAHRNEFLLTSEAYPLLQYVYIQECLQKQTEITLQLFYIELPKKSKKLAQHHLILEPDIFPPIKEKISTHTQPLLPQQSSTLMFKFTLRLPPSINAKETVFQVHSGVYYGRRCLFPFEPFSWNNTLIEEMTQHTTLPLASVLPGTLLCFALTNKQSKPYFLNVSLFRSNGALLNGGNEFTFNPVHATQQVANNKHLYPDSFIGSSNEETDANAYPIRLKFDFTSYRFYSNEEMAEQLKTITMPTPTVVSTAKQQQHQESHDDVANGEALNYLLGILSEEVKLDFSRISRKCSYWFD